MSMDETGDEQPKLRMEVSYSDASLKKRRRPRLSKHVRLAFVLSLGVVGVIASEGIFGRQAQALAITLSTLGTVLTAALGMLMDSSKQRRKAGRRIVGLYARGLTELAAALAGRQRSVLRDEWLAHLAGDNGHETATWRTVEDAFGFLESAVRFRGSDMADLAWMPVNAVLRSRTMSNLFVFIPTTAAAYMVLWHDGAPGVVTSAEGIVAIGGALYGLIRIGRWYRKVKPPDPKAQRAK